MDKPDIVVIYVEATILVAEKIKKNLQRKILRRKVLAHIVKLKVCRKGQYHNSRKLKANA